MLTPKSGLIILAVFFIIVACVFSTSIVLASNKNTPTTSQTILSATSSEASPEATPEVLTTGRENITNTSIESNLIPVVSVEGLAGYVLKSELEADDVRNLTDAAVYMAKNKGKIRFIPIYKEDGKTIIGKFQIGGGDTIINSN